MAKVRTTISLSEVSHQWLRERASSTGQMAEFIDYLIQKERALGPIENRLQRQTDRLDVILSRGQRS